MALIVFRDAKQRRERILNTDHIYQCSQADELVRIWFTQGALGNESAYVEGTVAEFAKLVGAARIG